MKFPALMMMLILFLSGAAAKADLPLPLTLYNMETLVSEFRDPLVTKISELHKNFEASPDAGGVSFVTDHDLKCFSSNVAKKDEVAARIEYKYQLQDQKLQEAISYYGCANRLIFSESIITEGKNLVPVGLAVAITGRVRIPIHDNETKRVYIIASETTESLFTLIQNRDATNNITAQLLVGATRAFQYREATGPAISQVNYALWPFHVVFRRSTGNWRLGSDDEVVFTIINRGTKSTYFRIGEREGMSSNDFYGEFSERVLSEKGPIGMMGGMIKDFIDEMPATQFVSDGIKTSRLLTDLRLMLNRLRNKQDNLVKIQLEQELIPAVTDGLIIDHRPPK